MFFQFTNTCIRYLLSQRDRTWFMQPLYDYNYQRHLVISYPMYFLFQGLSGKVKKNNLLQTIDSWGPFFKVTFDLMVHSKPSSYWSSILAFKGNNGSSDFDKYGDRAPAIFYNQLGKLHFVNAVNGNKRYVFDRPIDLGKWYKIEMEQVSLNGKVESLNSIIIYTFTFHMLY